MGGPNHFSLLVSSKINNLHTWGTPYIQKTFQRICTNLRRGLNQSGGGGSGPTHSPRGDATVSGPFSVLFGPFRCLNLPGELVSLRCIFWDRYKKTKLPNIVINSINKTLIRVQLDASRITLETPFIPNTAVFGPTNFIGTTASTMARMTVSALDEKGRFLRWPDGATAV